MTDRIIVVVPRDEYQRVRKAVQEAAELREGIRKFGEKMARDGERMLALFEKLYGGDD